MDGRVERLVIQNTQGHFSYLLLIMPQQLIIQTQPLDVRRNHMLPKKYKPRHPGPRGSGELGEDHHNQQFYLAG